MSLRRRYDTARRQGLEPGQCPACRDRQGLHGLVDARQQGRADGPAPCPVCDEVSECLIEVVETVVGEGTYQP